MIPTRAIFFECSAGALPHPRPSSWQRSSLCLLAARVTLCEADSAALRAYAPRPFNERVELVERARLLHDDHVMATARTRPRCAGPGPGLRDRRGLPALP